MRITKQMLGVMLGVGILLMGLFSLTYGATAFVLWELNPALWDVGGRIGAVVVMVVLIIGWFIFTQVQVVDSDEE